MNIPQEKGLDKDSFWTAFGCATVLSLDPALFTNDHVPYWAYAIRWAVLLIVFYFPFKALKGRQTEYRKPLWVAATIASVAIVAVVYYLYIAK